MYFPLEIPYVMIFFTHSVKSDFLLLKCNEIFYVLNTLPINLPIHTYRRSTTIRVEYILNYNNTYISEQVVFTSDVYNFPADSGLRKLLEFTVHVLWKAVNGRANIGLAYDTRYLYLFDNDDFNISRQKSTYWLARGFEIGLQCTDI